MNADLLSPNPALMVTTLLMLVAMMAAAWWFARALLRAAFRPRADAQAVRQDHERFLALEERVEAVADEMTRVHALTRFQAELLTRRLVSREAERPDG